MSLVTSGWRRSRWLHSWWQGYRIPLPGCAETPQRLGVLGSGSEEVTEALGQALGDADYLVGHNAALSLRKLGQATDDTIERLQEMSIHPELYRRKNALMALEVLLP